MPSPEELIEMEKLMATHGMTKPLTPLESERRAELEKRVNDLEAERLFAAARGSAAPSEPKLVIGGRVASGEEVLQAFKEMPRADRQSLLEDLRLLDMLEAEAQQNGKISDGDMPPKTTT
jgi:hypothetical protein